MRRALAVSAFTLAASVATAALADGPVAISETVDATGNAGAYSSIAVGSKQVPGIAYMNQSTGKVRFAHRTGGVWTSEDIGFGGATSNRSLALGAADEPRVVFEGTNVNVLAVKSAGNWSLAPVAGGYANWWTTQALDDQGTTRVAYIWSIGSGGGYQGGFALDGEDVAPNLFLPANPSCALAFDSQGRPHLVATLNEGDPIRYWTKDGADWTSEELPAGSWPALALDAQDGVHICYYDPAAGDLEYAIRAGSNVWLTETVDANGDVGKYPSLALDSAGRPRISYYDVTHGDLKFAAAQAFGWPWSATTVDAPGDVGAWSSLAIGSGDVFHISYYDAGNEDLKYALLTDYPTAVGSPSRRTGPEVRAVPNPFNPTTTLVYSVPSRGRVTVSAYDVCGRKVADLVDADRDPGEYRVLYQPRTASGVYFIHVVAGGRSATIKIVVLK